MRNKRKVCTAFVVTSIVIVICRFQTHSGACNVLFLLNLTINILRYFLLAL